jgi:hypothetical protein
MKLHFQGGASVLASRFLKMFATAREDARPTKFVSRFLAAIILFAAFGATAQTTNTLSDAEIQGRQLAQQLCEACPETNFIQTGVLQIRPAKGAITNEPVKFQTVVTETNWSNFYDRQGTNHAVWRLAIKHNGTNFTEYVMSAWDDKSSNSMAMSVPITDWQFFPFDGSDFSLGDLGLEFFHWPEQKILKKENRRSRECDVLESTNPNPSTNGYSRVVSWIDEESGGIIYAEAYDAQNKLLKEFDPKTFKKVNGQWQVELMEMENVQTGSRSWIDFNPGGTPPPKQQGQK